MAKVTTTFTSDDKEVVASIDKMNKKLAELEEKNKRLAAESAAAAQAAKEQQSNTLLVAGAVAAGIEAARQGMSVLNREMEYRNNLEKEYLNLQKGAAGGEREFLMNLGLVKGSDQKAAISRLQQISKSSGVAMTDLYGPAGASLSASGGNVDVAFDAIERAAKIAPHSAQTMQLIAGAMIDLGKASGDFDNTKGLDLLVKIGEIARAPDWTKIATNAPRAIAGTSAMGFTPEESTALLATLSNQMADKDLAVSGTASMTLASRLRKFFPEHDTVDKRGRVTSRGVGAMTGAERFAMVEGNEDLRRKFFNSLEESEAKPFIEQIVTPGTMLNKMYKQNLGDVQGMQRGSMGAFGDAISDTELQRTADQSRRTSSASERFRLAQTPAAQNAIVREAYQKSLEGLGYGWSSQFLAMRQYDVRKAFGADESPAAFAEAQLNAEILERTFDKGITNTNNLPEGRRREVEMLSEVVAELRAIRMQQRDATAANHTEGR